MSSAMHGHDGARFTQCPCRLGSETSKPVRILQGCAPVGDDCKINKRQVYFTSLICWPYILTPAAWCLRWRAAVCGSATPPRMRQYRSCLSWCVNCLLPCVLADTLHLCALCMPSAFVRSHRAPCRSAYSVGPSCRRDSMKWGLLYLRLLAAHP